MLYIGHSHHHISFNGSSDGLRPKFLASISSLLANELDRALRASVMVSISEERKYEQHLFRYPTVSVCPLYIEDLAEALTVQICGLLMQK